MNSANTSWIDLWTISEPSIMCISCLSIPCVFCWVVYCFVFPRDENRTFKGSKQHTTAHHTSLRDYSAAMHDNPSAIHVRLPYLTGCDMTTCYGARSKANWTLSHCEWETFSRHSASSWGSDSCFPIRRRRARTLTHIHTYMGCSMYCLQSIAFVLFSNRANGLSKEWMFWTCCKCWQEYSAAHVRQLPHAADLPRRIKRNIPFLCNAIEKFH